jgi:parallel beta-helix repeat protein
MRRCTHLLGAALASAVLLCALATPVTPAHAETALTAIEDAYVDPSLPTSNFGSATLLNTDGTPRVTTYLKFDVSGLPTPPSAALRLFTATGNDTPFEVRTVSDTSWSESTITAQNAPALGDIVAASGPVKPNTWYTLNVSSALAGDGFVTLALTTASGKATTIHSREGTNRPQLVIPAPPSPSPFVVRRSTADSSVYLAESASTGITYSGTLKSVMEPAVDDLSRAGGGIVHFNAGLYDLGDSQFELKDMVGVTFEGEGMDVTTISNFRSIAADTEVFDVARATRGGIRNLTISAGGPDRSTSDAIDYDAGNYQLIERVKIVDSRARGIIFDGKDLMGGIARGAANNVIRNCVITNVPNDGIKLVAASNNRVEGCTITNVGRHGIAAAKSSPLAALPNEKARNNVIIGNFVDEAGIDGISIVSGDANQVVGNTVLNSGNAASDRDGIRIASDDLISCDNNVVSGNTATDNQSQKTQRYGLSIFSGLCNGTSVSDNDFAGNLVGEILDYGTGTTYGAPPDVEAPSVPTGLTASAVGPTQVDLAWSAAADNIAVTGYTVYRNGTAIATVDPATTSFQDTTAAPNATHTYTVDAFDGATNRSAQSAPATVTTPAEGGGSGEPPPDTEPPSVPTDLTATPAGPTAVELAWSASTDNVAVAGYTIYRDGTAIATVEATASTFKDMTASPSTTYAYAVDAVDGSANRSPQSAAVEVTTPDPPPVPTFTFVPSADAYVSESEPTTNNGSRPNLRLDGSPVVRSYLRFSVNGVSGTVSRARLRLYANTSSVTGYEAHGASDTSWGELMITHANAPSFGSAISSSGAFASGIYTEVDVTPLITGDGVYTIVLTATGPTAFSLGSRESVNSPQLIVHTTS